MSNTITIELSAKDRELLDNLFQATATVAAALLQQGQTLDACTGLPATAELCATETENTLVSTGIPAENVEPAKPEKPAEPSEPEKPKATKEDIQNLARKLLAPGSAKRDRVKPIISKYADRISAIPADKYDVVMQELTALDKEG